MSDHFWEGLTLAWPRILENLDRLPPGLMFVGPRGLGKLDLALDAAAALLCTERRDHGAACGQCEACRKTAKGLHPDLKRGGLFPVHSRSEG